MRAGTSLFPRRFLYPFLAASCVLAIVINFSVPIKSQNVPSAGSRSAILGPSGTWTSNLSPLAPVASPVSAKVDVPFGVFTREQIAVLESVPADSSKSTKTPPVPSSGGHQSNTLTIVLDFKDSVQPNTSDVFGNVVGPFDVTGYGFTAGDFNTVANAIAAEVDEDYFAEMAGTVAGPGGQDLAIDFIIGDIGTAPPGLINFYYMQIGTGISGTHGGNPGVLGVAGLNFVRSSSGIGPNSVVAGDVVGSVFTDHILALGGLTPSDALTTGNLGFTTFAISGTTSHEAGHTVSLSHINKAGSVQPTAVPPLMGTGAIDLPNQDRIGERNFSLSGADGENGNAPRMHIQQLVNAISLHGTAAVPAATLGNLLATSVPTGDNAFVMPDAIPTNTTSINVSTSTDFKGQLEADPATGVVSITNAHPAGTYMLTVTAFNSAGMTTMTSFGLTVTAPAACRLINFAGATIATGQNPRSVAVGDFDRDGIQDLAVSSTANTVRIFLGVGDGTFTPVVPDVPVGFTPNSVVVGDFDGDGMQDLATANSGGGNASVMLGNGDGTFTPAVPRDTPVASSLARTIKVADLNNDHRQDFIVTNENGNTVSVRLGNGNGTFGGASNVFVGNNPIGASIGDFNADGRHDLAITRRTAGNTVLVLLNTTASPGGLATFGPSTIVFTAVDPYWVAVGNFNAGANQDLVIANAGASHVSVLSGNGTGGFAFVNNYASGSSPQAAETGDFNGDGNQDVVVANAGADNLAVLLGDGAGSFDVPRTFGTGTLPGSVAVGDFNGDGMQDLAATNYLSHNVTVLLRECPTAANVEIAGRVVNEFGQGVRGAWVSLTDSSGAVRSVRTSSFGYYRFGEVPSGATYVVAVSSKRYEFAPRVVQLFDSVTDLDFIAGAGKSSGSRAQRPGSAAFR